MEIKYEVIEKAYNPHDRYTHILKKEVFREKELITMGYEFFNTNKHPVPVTHEEMANLWTKLIP